LSDPDSRWRDRAIQAAFTVSLVLTGLVAGTFFVTQLGPGAGPDHIGRPGPHLGEAAFELAVGRVMPPPTREEAL
jgi:hypothetical protein